MQPYRTEGGGQGLDPSASCDRARSDGSVHELVYGIQKPEVRHWPIPCNTDEKKLYGVEAEP
jgi:hypothetical protein